MIVLDFDEHNPRSTGIAEGQRTHVAVEGRRRADLRRIARITGEQEEVQAIRIRRLERQRDRDGLPAADVVELVPEALRRAVGPSELPVRADRNRVARARPGLSLNTGQHAEQQRADEHHGGPRGGAPYNGRRRGAFH